MILRTVVASCIFAYLALLSISVPVPLRRVRAYVFTRADYYEHSAPLEVALCRESRGTSLRHVLAHRRVPTHSFVSPRWTFFTHKESISPGFMPMESVTSVSDVLPMGAHIHQSKLGFRQSSIAHSERAIRTPYLTTSSDMRRLPNMLLFRLAFAIG
jgi:hypothetical protein